GRLGTGCSSRAILWSPGADPTPLPIFPPNRRRRAGRGADRSVMVRRSGSNLCCPMSSRWKSLSALFTASAASRSVIACATCCGARWGSLCASWPLFIQPGGACLLMSTDLSLGAIDIIRIYGLRFKIEHMFSQAALLIGSFAYHFWMMDMTPLRCRNGTQPLHRQSDRYREKIRHKIHAYHVFMQAGAIAQGLLQYLSVVFPRLVWDSFG